MFKKALLFVGLSVLMAVITACSTNEGIDESENESNQNRESSENSQEYVVEHAMGSTPITGTPERIVVLTNHGTEALLSMGIKPVGAVKSWAGEPWYDHIADKMDGVEVVGTESDINLEAILALEPDLIIGNKMRQEEHYQALSDIAPTVFEETLRGDWKVNFKLIAEAVGQEEKGQEVLDAYNKRITNLTEELGDKIDTKVSMVRFMPQDVRIYHKDSFSGIILEEIGLARPEAQDVDDFAAKGVTKEQIEEMDGDIIFYFTYQKESDGQDVADKWLNDPLWNNLDAVQAGKAYEVSDTIWNTAGGVLAANLMLDDLKDKLLSQ